MKRLLLLASSFILFAGMASADHVQIKINLNRLDFIPEELLQALTQQMKAPATGTPGAVNPVPVMPAFPAPGRKNMGGFKQPHIPPPPPPPPPQGGAGAPMPPVVFDDPNPRWISVFTEVKFSEDKAGNPVIFAVPIPAKNQGNVKDATVLFVMNHKWGRGNWVASSPYLPMKVHRIEREEYFTDFDKKFKKQKAAKEKDFKTLIHLANQALAHSDLKKYRKVMAEAVEVSPNDPIVVNYKRVQKWLQAKLKEKDPTQTELFKDLAQTGYKPRESARGHYELYFQPRGSDAELTESTIKRRLDLLEDTLEIFYSWFAMQGDASPQPAFPKHRMVAVLVGSKEEFLTRHVQWGGPPMVADGFTPRRDNALFMSVRPRVNDPLFQEFETILVNQLAAFNQRLQAKFGFTVTRDDLLSGKVNEHKEASRIGVFIAGAKTAVLAAKAMEDEAERATITNDGIRQIMVAAEMFPRNVQIPEWMIEGLAAFFETPIGGAYPTVGTPSWTHNISFKYLRNTLKLDETSETKAQTLNGVISDYLLTNARYKSAEATQDPQNEALRKEAREAWELARCTAWSFVYFLAENKRLDYLFQYGKQLDSLPRDMDLDDVVLQACFARAFRMTDPKDPRGLSIDHQPFVNLAIEWFGAMGRADVQPLSVQEELMKQRVDLDADPAPPADNGAINPANPNNPAAPAAQRQRPQPNQAPRPGPGPGMRPGGRFRPGG